MDYKILKDRGKDGDFKDIIQKIYMKRQGDVVCSMYYVIIIKESGIIKAT
jgi:hypothetical protein